MSAAENAAVPPRTTPGRARGRRRHDDATDLRERLLDAALASYAAHGIAGSQLRRIAAAAGVTPALVHYYFGDGQQLQQAVIDERLLPLFAQVRQALEGGAQGGVRELLTGFVHAICGVVQAHPWLPPLWIREVVSEGGSLRELLVNRFAPELARLLSDRFAAEQAAGRLNPDLDPRLLMVSLVGLTMFPAAGMPIWRQLFDARQLGADAIGAHALALLERGLELPA